MSPSLPKAAEVADSEVGVVAAYSAVLAREGAATGHRRRTRSAWGQGSKRRREECVAPLVADQERSREERDRYMRQQAGWYESFGWRDRIDVDTPSVVEALPRCVLETNVAYNRVLDRIVQRPLHAVGKFRRRPMVGGASRRCPRARRTGRRRRSRVGRGTGGSGWSGIIAHSESVRRAAKVLLERYLDEVEGLGVVNSTRQVGSFRSILRAHRGWYRRNLLARGDFVVTMLQTVSQARADGRTRRDMDVWSMVPDVQEEERRQARVMSGLARRKTTTPDVEGCDSV